MSSNFPLDSETIHAALSKEKWWARFIFWTAAAFLGFMLIFFAKFCGWANYHFFSWFYDRSPYLPFLICPLGLWIIYILQTRFFPNSDGSGIPQVIAALKTRSPSQRDKLLSIRILFGKVICTFLGLLSGASIGREGPSVHIGASLFNFLGHYARFSKFERRQGLVIAGAAAGIAAAFNAPLAGIVFAIEELKSSFEERTSGLMLSAIILAGLIALAVVGQYSYFGRIAVELPVGPLAIAAMVVIGVLGGLMGGLFSRAILHFNPNYPKIFARRPYLMPIALGLVLAFLGYSAGGKCFGTGYAQARELLHSPNSHVVLYPFFKLLATLTSYLSGVAGGVFAPSLSVGAGIGALVHPLFSGEAREALLLMGMVSYLSGVIRAPVTAFVIVYEMTENHRLLLHLMAAAFIAVAISKLVCDRPLYHGLSEIYIKRDKVPKEELDAEDSIVEESPSH